MFFDWEYHEPKGYISHRFSKGDIAFVQNRYRGMEWTCMVGRKNILRKIQKVTS